jgi:hypothetical protein
MCGELNGISFASSSSERQRRYAGGAEEVFLFHDAKMRPEERRVEEINGDGDGSCFVDVFSGVRAEQRAKRFADRLRANTD